MSKYWKVGMPEDALHYFVVAPNRGVAIKLVEQFTGPLNPARVQCAEQPQAPAGYLPAESSQCVLDEDPDYES